MDLNKALAALDRAEALAPNSALSHYSVAVSMTIPGDYARALRAMERTLVLDPLNVTVARVNAQTQVVAGRWTEAQAFFNECSLSNCIESVELDLYEIVARTHMGQEALALAALDRIESAAPPDSHVGIAGVRAIILAEPLPDAALAYLSAFSGDRFWQLLGGEILLSKGALELPDEFRKYPGYRNFWDRDGWRDIARARIANGHTAGLPLNEDGTLVQF